MSTTPEVNQEENIDPSYRHGPGFLLATLGAIAERRWTAHLKDAKLRRADYSILAALHESGPMRQRDAATHAGMDPRNAVAIVEDLRQRDLLGIAPDPSDKRAKVIQLTSRGSSVMNTLLKNLHQDRDEFFGSLTEADYRTLSHLLREVYDSHTR